MTLAPGLHPVPQGHLAAVVTSLDMTAPGLTAPKPFPEGIEAFHAELDPADYRALFRAIGTPWLWTSRLLLDDAALATIVKHPQVETWVIRRDGSNIGLVELDFRTTNICELAFFGLITTAAGQGLGGPMMALAQNRAFSRPITRFHVRTCTLDAPTALPFYQKAGFTPSRIGVEVFPDPRIAGVLPKSAARHIPYLP